MKCDEPYPQGSYEECQLDLLHRGDHEYFGTKWPRLVPAEPNPAIEALLNRAARETRAWGMEDRKYPVIIERTLTYVYWVDAASEDDALADVNGGAWEISLDKEMPIDGSDHVRRLDEFERSDAWSGEIGYEFGPRIQCPDCRCLAFRREWFHNPYYRCHGPIVWRKHPGALRPWNERNASPVYGAALAEVA